MSTPTIDIDTKEVITKELVLEMAMEGEEANPEVVEVLAEVPQSPRTSRPNPTPTKESMNDKKGKHPTISVHASLRRNPPKPTTQ